MATSHIFSYGIYSITEIVFNGATPLLTYKATEKIKLSLVVYVSYGTVLSCTGIISLFSFGQCIIALLYENLFLDLLTANILRPRTEERDYFLIKHNSKNAFP